MMRCSYLTKCHPDMAMFSKTISNGFAMAAVIGRKEVMEACQNTFVSSTYWTERIGPVAALATIRKFQRCNVQKHLCRMGALCKQGWREAAKESGLEITVDGFDAWPSFAFSADYDKLSGQATTVLATLFTQLMLDRGFLATTSNVMTFAHKREHIEAYIGAVKKTFITFAKWVNEASSGKNLNEHLRGPVKHSGFLRLCA